MNGYIITGTKICFSSYSYCFAPSIEIVTDKHDTKCNIDETVRHRSFLSSKATDWFSPIQFLIRKRLLETRSSKVSPVAWLIVSKAYEAEFAKNRNVKKLLPKIFHSFPHNQELDPIHAG